MRPLGEQLGRDYDKYCTVKGRTGRRVDNRRAFALEAKAYDCDCHITGASCTLCWEQSWDTDDDLHTVAESDQQQVIFKTL